MKAINPSISIVTPSYNQAEFLEATIDSVLSQNYPSLEYIIIDGGSTDGSVDIIKKHEKHLTFWCSEPDSGQYDAINKGFRYSTGEIMAWINSDDMYLPWALKTVADIMSSLPTVEWLTTLYPGHWDYCGFCKGFGNTPGFSLDAFLDGYYLPTNGVGYWIQQESTFWRRSLWVRSGSCLNNNLKLAGDFELWCRFYLHTNLYGTASPLGGFRFQYCQKSKNIQEYISEATLALLAMRQHLNWNYYIKTGKNRVFHQIRQIPKLTSSIISRWGYNGKKIVRVDSDHPDGYWKIEDYRF
ncbi:glycosyl transferase [Cylindrospermopsis raciborskii CS-508]|uniref:glycosyltransferase family 2 protein n=1 Tax=Cylindrospermopsis raciborskii TaxID=77022 RepID=UPI0008DC9E93|nr:glycosyltransferase family 2 protein [Cylindrospermopsis raciborskii]OHY33029.1 glycosyl transferase [Cylindrospermopsis raciborskii CS-508]